MAAAIPTADSLALKFIALNLLERYSSDGTAALVQHYDHLPPRIQAMIVQKAGQWYGPLREVAGYKSVQGPANVIRIVVAAKAAKLAYLIVEQLRHRPEALRIQAAQGLLDLARWARDATQGGIGDKPTCGTESACYIQTAVEEAVKQYHTHDQMPVLLALVALAPRPMPTAFSELAGDHHDAVAAMSRMLAGADHMDIRRAMLMMIQVPTLQNGVLKGLFVAAASGMLGDVLLGSHLLLSQRITQPLQPINRPEALWPSARELPAWSVEQTRGLAQWAISLPLTKPQRVEKLLELRLLPDALARLAALRQLIMLSDGGEDTLVNDAIGRFCEDREMKLAWIALHSLIGCGWGRLTSLLPGLINSEHPEVAGLARERLAPLAFKRLWEGWSRMLPAQRFSIGRALVKIDAAFHSHLSQKLTGEHQPDCLRALSMIHILNQGALFEQALLVLATSSDEKIVASAARALGSAQSHRSVKALEVMLDHSDSRVRANAIEALQQLRSKRHVKELVHMAHEEQSRPRANAIKALMQMNAGDSLTALGQMLHDPRPAQRASALWVVEAMGLVEVVREVAEMSITDTDREIKGRANRVIHELMGMMSSGHAGPETQKVAAG